MIIAGADNRPTMLEKSLYDSWKSHMEHYMENRRMILNSVQNGPLIWPTVTETDGLPPDVYAIVNHHKVEKEIWDGDKLLMQGTKLSLQEKEFQVNIKFMNSLLPEWSKFVTDVKLARDLHTTNYDQLYSYLGQHEVHANETRLMRKLYQDPLAFVANYNQPSPQLTNYHSQYNPTHVPQQTNNMIPQVHSPQSFTPMYPPTHPSQPQINHSSVPPSHPYQSQVNHQTSSIPQIAYNSPQPLTEFPQMDSGLAVPVFNQGYDLIACLNKAMAFLTVVASSSYKGKATSSGGNNTGGQARVVKCYNCQGEGHMARQCSQPKRPRNAAWYKEKAMLAEALEAGQILDEKQLAFLAYLGYQNMFYLKKAQRIKPTLYDGSVIFDKHVASPVFDDEETLILEELNRLSEDFGKRVVPQQELSDKQAFWLQTLHPNTDQSASSPVKIEAPRELPKITPDALTEGEWGFEHTKAIFLNEIIPFLKTLKDIFNVFDKDLLNEDSLSNNQNALEILEYFENNDLKAQLQAKDTTICKLKEHIKTIRENDKKEKVQHEMDKIETINIELEHSMFKLDLDPLAPRLLKNREAHTYYLKHTHEQANILQGIVEQAKEKQPLDNALDLACNKKNDRILQKPSSNSKNKVEAQPRKVNKKNRVKEPICGDNVKHTMLNANSPLVCVKCKHCMFDANHDVCFLYFVNDVNMHAKSKSKSKKSQVQNNWKPTGKVFTDVGLKWKPTRRFFIIVGNSCPLTRLTPNKIVPLKETTYNSVEIPKPEIKVYSRRPKQIKSVVQIVLWYLDSGCSKHMTGNRTQLMNFVSKFLGTVRFRNDQIAKIMGYGDYQWGNVIILRVYYVEGLRHNLFSVGQFCDADLEVTFWKNTCFIWNLEGVDLLLGSRDTNLYIISLDDMLKTSLICLLSKASKTKSWLWHHRLSHLNFGTLNKLAKDGLARSILKFKF
ncbi:retrovirus-related pol polyprotein from transposon TNT 1-94 [Tanacetum coccineum]